MSANEDVTSCSTKVDLKSQLCEQRGDEIVVLFSFFSRKVLHCFISFDSSVSNDVGIVFRGHAEK